MYEYDHRHHGRGVCGSNGICVLRHDVDLGDDRFPQEGGNAETDLGDDLSFFHFGHRSSVAVVSLVLLRSKIFDSVARKI